MSDSHPPSLRTNVASEAISNTARGLLPKDRNDDDIHMSSFPYRRIVVTGTTSSGKSTLAKSIADKLGYDFIELDALHWDPNWTEAPNEIFRERVSKAIQAPAWVVAGNYSTVRDLIWSQAEAVIWLDYPFSIVFWRLTRRTFSRWWYQEELWNSNRERLWLHFKLWSDESLYKWLFKTYWRRKRETPTLVAEYKHLKLIHLTHPNNTDKWLNTLSAKE